MTTPTKAQRGTEGHARLVRGVLRARGVPTACLDDAVQRVFLVAASRASDIHPGKETGFLVAVAERIAREAWRGRREDPSDTIDDLPHCSPLADEILRARERADAVQRGLASLPEELRKVVERSDMGDEPAPSIAASMGIPVGTVASRLRRGRAELKKRLRAEREQPALHAVIWALLRRPRAWASAAPASAAPLGGAILTAAVAVAVLAQPPAIASGTSPAPRLTVASSVTAPAKVAPSAGAADLAAAPLTVDFESLPPAPVATAFSPHPDGAPTRGGSRSDLEKEATDLQSAVARLESGDPAGALALVENWTVHHGHAVLTEDAAAVEVAATARLGRKERACALATIFRKRWPESMHDARIVRTCPAVTP